MCSSFSLPEIFLLPVIPASCAHVHPCLPVAPSLQILSPPTSIHRLPGQGGWATVPGASPQETLPGLTACLSLLVSEPLAPLLPRAEDRVLLGPALSDLV